MKRHSAILTLAVAFLFVISSIGAQSRGDRSTGGSSRDMGGSISRGQAPAADFSSRGMGSTTSRDMGSFASRDRGGISTPDTSRSAPITVKSEPAPSPRMSGSTSGDRSTGSSFSNRSAGSTSSNRYIPPEPLRDPITSGNRSIGELSGRRDGSPSNSRPVIKSTPTDTSRSYRSTGDSRSIQPMPGNRGSDSSSNNSMIDSRSSSYNRAYRDRPSDQSEISKSYRSTSSSSTPWSSSSGHSNDFSTRRDNSSSVKPSNVASVTDRSYAASRSTGYRDRNTYAETARVKSSNDARYDRNSGSRDRSGWSFSGSFAYASDNYFVGVGGHYSDGRYYNRGHYYDQGHYYGNHWRRPYPYPYCYPYAYYPPRYRYYAGVSYNWWGQYPYYGSYYRYYPSSYYNVSLGYFGSDWFGGFSFASAPAVVTEVRTVYTESVWVPGHYEYREETVVIPDGNKEWVPPVYEEYWDGGAWVRRLVSGGYWKTSPVTETVTNRVWVEGYWTTR